MEPVELTRARPIVAGTFAVELDLDGLSTQRGGAVAVGISPSRSAFRETPYRVAIVPAGDRRLQSFVEWIDPSERARLLQAESCDDNEPCATTRTLVFELIDREVDALEVEWSIEAEVTVEGTRADVPDRDFLAVTPLELTAALGSPAVLSAPTERMRVELSAERPVAAFDVVVGVTPTDERRDAPVMAESVLRARGLDGDAAIEMQLESIQTSETHDFFQVGGLFGGETDASNDIAWFSGCVFDAPCEQRRRVVFRWSGDAPTDVRTFEWWLEPRLVTYGETAAGTVESRIDSGHVADGRSGVGVLTARTGTVSFPAVEPYRAWLVIEASREAVTTAAAHGGPLASVAIGRAGVRGAPLAPVRLAIGQDWTMSQDERTVITGTGGIPGAFSTGDVDEAAIFDPLEECPLEGSCRLRALVEIASNVAVEPNTAMIDWDLEARLLTYDGEPFPPGATLGVRLEPWTGADPTDPP